MKKKYYPKTIPTRVNLKMIILVFWDFFIKAISAQAIEVQKNDITGLSISLTEF